MNTSDLFRDKNSPSSESDEGEDTNIKSTRQMGNDPQERVSIGRGAGPFRFSNESDALERTVT